MTTITGTPGYPSGVGKIEVTCETTAILVVTVYCHGFSDRVANATVELSLVGNGTTGSGVTDKNGVVTFKITQAPATPCDYRLKTTHPRTQIDYDGDRFTNKIERGKASTTSVQCICEPLELQMFLDANRDGQIDAEPTDNRAWTWGKKGTGAVLMVRTTTEYEVGDQVLERTEVQFRWKTIQDEEEEWTASVAFQPERAVRVFAGQGQGTALLDHRGGLDLRGGGLVPDENGNISVWVEATAFATQMREREVTITFDHDSGHRDGTPLQQVAVTRIAPWIMSSDMDETLALFIIKFDSQKKIKNGPTTLSNDGLLAKLGPWMGSTELVPITGALTTPVRYLRDAMRFGAQTGPGISRHQAVVMRGNNSSTNYTVPKLDDMNLVGRGVAYTEHGDLVASDLQTGGNMMVSPPTKEYPWGRIICGGYEKGTLGPWAAFFDAQEVQKPIKIDTSWLNVGHSDEIVAFVPNCKGPGFKMLLASPRRAYQLMCAQDLGAVTALRTVTDDSDAFRGWNERLDILHQAASVDFSNPELHRPPAEGNGRLCFHRFGNVRDQKQRWLDQFLLNDRMLQAMAGTPGPEASQIVAQQAKAGFDKFCQVAIDKKNWKSPRWTTIKESGPTKCDNSHKQLLLTDLRSHCKKTSSELKRVFDADKASLLGRLYCIEQFSSNNGEWTPDYTAARYWLNRAKDGLVESLPLDPYDNWKLFTEVCMEAFDHLPTMAAKLDDPTQDEPQHPIPMDITARIFEDLGVKYNADLGPTTVGPTELVNNLTLQLKLDKIRATIQAELEIDDEDIIEVPILFGSAGGNAQVADMVNLVQLNKPTDALKSGSRGCTCIIPTAHGPIIDDKDIFVEDLDGQLRALGIDTHFVDEWYEYHLNDGEIHCGSNQLQRTLSQPWWEYEPPSDEDELHEREDEDANEQELPVEELRGVVVNEAPEHRDEACDICGGGSDLTSSNCSVAGCNATFTMGRASECQQKYFAVRDTTPRDSSVGGGHGNRCREHLLQDGATVLSLSPESVTPPLCRDRH